MGWSINTGERLAEQLMVYYAWGILDLVSPLLEDFWNNADITFRTHALHFIGRIAKDVPPNFIKRFQELWESRLAKASALGENPEIEAEIKEFGWWFASGAYSDEWSLENLDLVINLLSNIENDYFVIERLAILSEKYQFQTENLLEKLLENETPWRIAGSKEYIETVLRNAVKSQDKKASIKAKEFINRLAAKGYSFFTHLLSE